MPKIKTQRTKKAPAGWDESEPTLLELQQKLRDGKFIAFIYCEYSWKWAHWRKEKAWNSMANIQTPPLDVSIHIWTLL